MGRVCDLERSILLIISRTLPGGRNFSLSGEPFPLAFVREGVREEGEASSCAGEGAIVVDSSGGVGVGGRILGDSSSSRSRQSSVLGGVLWAMNCVQPCISDM